MKKLLLLAMFALYISAHAQGESYLSGLLDVRNATIGSQPTNDKAAIDAMFKCTMVANNGFKMDVKYESFNKIGFSRFGVSAGYVINWDLYIFRKDINITIAPSMGVSSIYRDWDYYYKDFVINPELSVPIRYKFNDKWGVEVHPELLFRGDLHERYSDESFKLKDDVKPSILFGITYTISK